MRSYVVAKRQATRWLRGGLVVVWVVVAWRTGATAIGYSLRAFEADLQSLLSSAPIHTVPLRHPYGGVVELTAEELRSAYWIAPHLDWASLCFVQGAWLSALIWLGRSCIWGDKGQRRILSFVSASTARSTNSKRVLRAP